MAEMEKKAEDGNGKDKEQPAPIQIVITYRNGHADLSGNIPESPVITLGMLEDAKVKLIGFYSQQKLREHMAKDKIIKPSEAGNNFINGLKSFLKK